MAIRASGVASRYFPTKALLRSAEIYDYMQHARGLRLVVDNAARDPKSEVGEMVVKQWLITFGILFLAISNTSAFAGDYTVVYALEIGEQTETGKVESCEYVKQ